MVQDSLKKFTSCFDEYFNKVTYMKHVNVHLLHYREETKEVEHLYLGSQFMGHGVANNMGDFKKVHKELDTVNN